MIGFLHYPSWISPDIIPGLPLRWYGLMYVVAFAITYMLFRYQIKQRKLQVNDDLIINLFFWGIIGLLIGGRIVGTTVYDPTHYYIGHPWRIFWPFEGGHFVGLAGMSYHGGLLGAIIAIVIYGRAKKIDVLDWGDMLISGVPLGYTFGRLGNFINGELWGRVTTLPWGMYYPHAERLSTQNPWVQQIAEKVGISLTGPNQMVNLPRHPSELYEALFEGIVLWLLIWFIFRKHKPFKGFVVGMYVIGYGFFRFLLEYLREPDPGIGFPIHFQPLVDRAHPALLFNFTMGQILCFLMIVSGIVYLLILNARFRRSATGEPQQAPRSSARRLRKKLK